MLPVEMNNKGFIQINGENYMDGRQVANILHKEFKHIVRDLKKIIAAVKEVDSNLSGDKDGPKMDHVDLIDIFEVKGVIAKKDNRGYVSEVLINEEYCNFLQMYSDFRYSVKLYREWQALKDIILLNYDQSLKIAITNCEQTEQNIKQAVSSLNDGKNLEAANHLSAAVNASKRVGSIGSKHLNQRKKDIKALKFVEEEVSKSLNLDLF